MSNENNNELYQAGYRTAEDLDEMFGGLTMAGIRYRMNNLDFPRPIHVGKKPYWKIGKVLEWVENQTSYEPAY